jgi:hypothetical protein
VLAQAYGGPEIPGLEKARNFRKVGLIVFIIKIRLENHVCLSF